MKNQAVKKTRCFKKGSVITITRSLPDNNTKQFRVSRVKYNIFKIITLRWHHKLWVRFRNRVWGLFHKLEIELPFTAYDINRLTRLGLSKNQIRKVAEIGLLPDNSIHWHFLVEAQLDGNLDELLACPPEYISQRYRKRERLQWNDK